MIDFSQTPVFEKYAKSRKDKTDHSVQICEDILNELGVVIVPGTDFGMTNSARLSLVLHKEAFSEAMDSQIATKSDLLEMENRLIKWGLGLALGQIAIIAALVKIP